MAETFGSLPALNDTYPLNDRDVTQYQADGHVLLRGLASQEEIRAYRPFIAQTLANRAPRKKPREGGEDYSSLFVQVTNVWRLHDAALRFVIGKRFARTAAGLMGVRSVRLYHDQALFKPPQGKGTPWHQDQLYWPLATPRTITMWMPLIDLTRDMGTMLFAGGSHLHGQLGDVAISEASDRYFDELVRERGFPIASYDLKAGDATFHAGWTAHAAHPNASSVVREVMTVIYYEDGAQIMEPDNKYRLVDMEAFFPGQRPGETAASVLNPVLYQA